MKFNKSIVTFAIVMVALIITIVLSFMLPLNQILAIPFFMIGIWLILLGVMQEAKPHELITTASIYVIYGGLMLTVSITYLTYINIPDVRFSLLILIFGVTLTVILSYFIEKRKRQA
jgi:hypothetical protein